VEPAGARSSPWLPSMAPAEHREVAGACMRRGKRSSVYRGVRGASTCTSTHWREQGTSRHHGVARTASGNGGRRFGTTRMSGRHARARAPTLLGAREASEGVRDLGKGRPREGAGGPRRRGGSTARAGALGALAGATSRSGSNLFYCAPV
jgi:hypothetical protein